MTQEEKQLLLKDLCARLPYRVIVHIKLNHNIHGLEYNSLLHGFMLSENVGISQLDGYTKFINLNEDEVKPYLRPMSSMTEEEKKVVNNLIYNKESIWTSPVPVWVINESNIGDYVDFCNSHYLDWRGLIPMGLALEAPEEMYKTE